MERDADGGVAASETGRTLGADDNGALDVVIPKIWPHVDIPEVDDRFGIWLNTSWQDGLLYYNVAVSPSTNFQALQQTTPDLPIAVALLDARGAEILKIPLSVHEFVATVDNNQLLLSYSVDGRAACSRQTYVNAKMWQAYFGSVKHVAYGPPAN